MQATILQTLQQHLCAIPEFKQYSYQHQFTLTEIFFTLYQKQREHEWYGDYSYHRSKDFLFTLGNGYRQVLYPFIETIDHYSQDKKITKAHRLRPHVQAAMNAYMNTNTGLSELITKSGQTIRTAPNKGIISSIVPINVDALTNLIDRLLLENKQLSDFDVSTAIMRAKSLRKAAGLILTGGKGIIQQYYECDSGRLYAKGGKINLQTMPNIIVDAALDGMWSYDISNCHYVIMQKLCKDYGMKTPFIQEYLDNKQELRESLASDIVITISQAKQCLIAMMYGSSLSLWEESAIPKMIGKEKAAKLYQNSFYMGLYKEVSRARHVICSEWEDQNRQSLLNPMGKVISKKLATKYLMAHISQGMESKMLRSAIDRFGCEVVLLKHDGFTLRGEHDMSGLQNQIESETGIQVEIGRIAHAGGWKEEREIRDRTL